MQSSNFQQILFVHKAFILSYVESFNAFATDTET